MKKTYFYTTYFDSNYRPFYKYSSSKRNKNHGFIPAGIDITYKRKHLSTQYLMQLIHLLWMQSEYPKDIIVYNLNDWYDTKENNTRFNMQLFYNVIKECEARLETGGGCRILR